MIDEIKDDVHIFIYYISPLDIGCFIGSQELYLLCQVESRNKMALGNYIASPRTGSYRRVAAEEILHCKCTDG